MTKLVEVKRGDIWYVDLGSSTNSVQAGVRPCIVVSNDTCNRYSPVINVIPLTSRQKRKLPTHVAIGEKDGLKVESIALAEQIISIGKEQLIDKISKCNYETIKKIDVALMIQSNTSRYYKVVVADIQRELQLRDLGVDFAIIKTKYNQLHEELKLYCEMYDIDYEELVDEKNL